MKILTSIPPVVWLAIGVMTIFLLVDIQRVPFHPDESTQLYMSSDFEALLSHPTSLGWDPGRENDLRQRYRELDAPLTKYILGAGRQLAGLAALPVDWDWSKTWAENQVAGALPSPQLLYAGRLAVALLLPFSLFFIYLVGSTIGGRVAGLLAALLLGTCALILLHDRRAMAEGALTLGVILSLWGFLQAEKRPWLAGLCVAVAFNAKQTTLALLPIGLLATAWMPAQTPNHWRKVALNIFLYLGVFATVTFLLNPLWWNNPIQAIRASLAARQDLLRRQIVTTEANMPWQVLQSPGERTAILVANLFIMPPAFAETGNYTQETSYSEAVYLAVPGHNVLRGFVGGGLFLLATIFGLILSILQLHCMDKNERRAILLLLLATISQAAVLVASIPLAWQRYAIPLVPMTCLWAAYGLSKIFHSIAARRFFKAS